MLLFISDLWICWICQRPDCCTRKRGVSNDVRKVGIYQWFFVGSLILEQVGDIWHWQLWRIIGLVIIFLWYRLFILRIEEQQ